MQNCFPSTSQKSPVTLSNNNSMDHWIKHIFPLLSYPRLQPRRILKLSRDKLLALNFLPLFTTLLWNICSISARDQKA